MFKYHELNKKLRAVTKKYHEKIVSPKKRISRNSREYKEWRYLVLKKDGFKCVLCLGTKKLQAHHVKNWLVYPKLRLKVFNGVTYCKLCRRKEDLSVTPEDLELTASERETLESYIDNG